MDICSSLDTITSIITIITLVVTSDAVLTPQLITEAS